MFTLRAIAKLLARPKPDLDENSPKSTGLLGDWYATLLYVDRKPLILAVSAKTLLPVVLPAKEIRTLPVRLPLAVGEALAALEIPEEKVPSRSPCAKGVVTKRCDELMMRCLKGARRRIVVGAGGEDIWDQRRGMPTVQVHPDEGGGGSGVADAGATGSGPSPGSELRRALGAIASAAVGSAGVWISVGQGRRSTRSSRPAGRACGGMP